MLNVSISKEPPTHILWEGTPKKLPYLLHACGLLQTTVFFVIAYLMSGGLKILPNFINDIKGQPPMIIAVMSLFVIGIPAWLIWDWIAGIYNSVTTKYFITNTGTTIKQHGKYYSLTWDIIRKNQPHTSLRKEWNQDIWQTSGVIEHIFGCQSQSYARKYTTGANKKRNLYREVGTFFCLAKPDAEKAVYILTKYLGEK